MITLENVTSTASRPSGRPAVDGVSLHVPEGQWVAVAGPNGSGKSTLLRLMNGLLPARDGAIRVDGIELGRETVWEVRARIGFVFQNPESQSVGQTVAEDIVFGLENMRLDRQTMRERLHAWADRLGVAELLERHPGRLSGGQQQRVALAAVLAMEPRVLLLDEATSMLDESSRFELLNLLRELRAAGGYTIVSVTHDWDELAAADRVVALREGRIFADGAPRDVLADEGALAACRLRAPYARVLGAALRGRGIDVFEDGGWWSPADEERMVSTLWSYASSK